MSKEGEIKTGRELEKQAFNKILLFGGLSVAGTAGACAHPIFVIPTVFCYGALVASFRHYENLTK